VCTAQAGPENKCGVTLATTTAADAWFAYQADETVQETRDQQMLELFWASVHKALPELGGSIEVLETANPLTFYDETRRKLGMVKGAISTPGALFGVGYRTSVPKVFIVNDTVTTPDLAAVTQLALDLASHLARPKKPSTF
ncbi:MAG: hypothetical protein ABR555_09815, partial [Pyrinomonadaceae bacterium]